jgi:hypothetical protein
LAAVSLPEMMAKRAFLLMVVLSLASAADVWAQSAASDSATAIGPAKPDLFLRVLANQKKAEAALDVYERTERVETRKSSSDPAAPIVKIARVIPTGTGTVRLPMRDDGKPIDEAAYRIELEGIAKALGLLTEGNNSQRDALEKYAKKKKDRNDLIDATHNAFLFTLVGSETRGGLTLSKFKMDPNPAFRPTSRLSSIFPKVHGFVCVDEASGELARIEGEVTEDISVGLFLGKIYKGSHFMQERYEVRPGLWEASFSQYDFDGRKLFSGFSVHERTSYSNYRYIGSPKEALAAIRQELDHAELDKRPTASNQQ